jgi:hypothetical protein
MGCPKDEYSPEIGAIVPRVTEATSAGEVRRIFHEEFVRWFGEGTAGPENAYEQPSLRIWEAVAEFHVTPANKPNGADAPDVVCDLVAESRGFLATLGDLWLGTMGQ